MAEKLNIGLDVMGGDFAPGCNFDGIVLALAEYGERLHLTLFGPEAVLREGLSQHGIAEGAVTVVDAPEAIEMGESPKR